MSQELLTDEIKQQLGGVGPVEIVVGIPSYNNVRTIGRVVQAAQVGLLKYFPERRALIVNSDGGSKDGTRQAVEEANVDSQQVLLVRHALYPVHRLTTPYHGIPGKGSAFRTIFRIAEEVQATACAVVDSDLRSITPEWIDLLLRPVLDLEFDYVAPYYKRHKYDGTITNSIIYPLTSALYGRRIRQPIGGEFGMAARVARHYLGRDVWNTEVAGYGIDIWMTTTAIAEGFKVCQSYLGAKIHDAKDPGADLSTMLVQVVGSVFRLMEDYMAVWPRVAASEAVPLFGFPFEVGLEPVPVNVARMRDSFRQGCRDLTSVYQAFVPQGRLAELTACAALADDVFVLPDELWANLVYDFALAYHRRTLDRGHLVKSLTPLYLGWVASFAGQTAYETGAQVEDRIELLRQVYEQLKPRLIQEWGLEAGEKRSES
ncbi:MAG TPA: glycosyl transferase family 2 [Terriglobia bacterium]|nr:glycosyl transferase family 2 [Terriglobia bacterium]